MKLTDVLKFAGELDAIKFYVEILTGLTFALIVAVAFATWKVSDREVKIIEKTLRGEFERKFDELNEEIKQLTTITDETFSVGAIALNGWKINNDDKRKQLHHIRMANVDIYQLRVKIFNDSCATGVQTIMVIPNNLYIKDGHYCAYDEVTNQWVVISVQQGKVSLLTTLIGKASLTVKLTGYCIIKQD